MRFNARRPARRMPPMSRRICSRLIEVNGLFTMHELSSQTEHERHRKHQANWHFPRHRLLHISRSIHAITPALINWCVAYIPIRALYASETDRDGMTMRPSRRSVLGGLAMMATGYERGGATAVGRNIAVRGRSGAVYPGVDRQLLRCNLKNQSEGHRRAAGVRPRSSTPNRSLRRRGRSVRMGCDIRSGFDPGSTGTTAGPLRRRRGILYFDVEARASARARDVCRRHRGGDPRSADGGDRAVQARTLSDQCVGGGLRHRSFQSTSTRIRISRPIPTMRIRLAPGRSCSASGSRAAMLSWIAIRPTGNKPKPYLDRVIIRFIPDAGARSAAFEAKELDLAATHRCRWATWSGSRRSRIWDRDTRVSVHRQPIAVGVQPRQQDVGGPACAAGNCACRRSEGGAGDCLVRLRPCVADRDQSPRWQSFMTTR